MRLTAIVVGVLALAYIVVIVRGVARSGRGPTLLRRDLWRTGRCAAGPAASR